MCIHTYSQWSYNLNSFVGHLHNGFTWVKKSTSLSLLIQSWNVTEGIIKFKTKLEELACDLHRITNRICTTQARMDSTIKKNEKDWVMLTNNLPLSFLSIRHSNGMDEMNLVKTCLIPNNLQSAETKASDLVQEAPIQGCP